MTDVTSSNTEAKSCMNLDVTNCTGQTVDSDRESLS